MKPSVRSPLPLALLLCSCLAGDQLLAQDGGGEPLTSGPPAGTKLTPVPCYATDGRLAGQEFDAAAKLASGPAALLFVHELNRNTAPVLRGLDNLTTEFSVAGFRSFTILLGADRTASEDQLKRVNGSLRLANPLVLSTDGAEGPGNYALSRKCTLTLVLVKDGAVHESIALTDTGPGDLPKLRQWVEAVAGALPEGEQALRELIVRNLPADAGALKELAANQALELRQLRAQLTEARQQRAGRPQEGMRGGQRAGDDPAPPARPDAAPNPDRVGKPPEDPQLNTLLRAFIRQTNDAARADEVYADIVARAAESAELEAEAIEMFRLMLSFRDRYGIAHAQDLAEGFLKDHQAAVPAAPAPPTPGRAPAPAPPVRQP